jgi:hypothetical protein
MLRDKRGRNVILFGTKEDAEKRDKQTFSPLWRLDESTADRRGKCVRPSFSASSRDAQSGARHMDSAVSFELSPIHRSIFESSRPRFDR